LINGWRRRELKMRLKELTKIVKKLGNKK